jgi:hypothetical protein
MRTYTNERTYRDLNMPNTTTTCFRTSFAQKETTQPPAAKAKQRPQVAITKVSKKKPTLLQRIKMLLGL